MCGCGVREKRGRVAQLGDIGATRRARGQVLLETSAFVRVESA
jgi:hypothetical protein